jgi:YggT family protein
MNTFAEIGIYIVQTLGFLYLLVVLLRFLLQVARADFYNPLSQGIVKLTNPLLIPLRKVVPGVLGIDLASLVLALLVAIITFELIFLMTGRLIPVIPVITWAALACLNLVLNIFFFGLIISIIFSWIAPYSRHPVLILLHQLMEPALAPFRRLIPSLGGLDITPIFAFLVINVLRKLVNAMAHSAGMPGLLLPGI